MGYKIEDIEGIGPAYAEKLAGAGIKNTDAFLAHCASRKGRKRVAEQVDIFEKHLLKWANLADLMRISGIGPQFSELLEAAGVDTVKELRNRNAENLAAKMKEVQQEKRLTRTAPGVSTVSRWVAQAKAMDPIISH
ncbi:MAG: DUF4332 domain-containing protein [bacterium]|nr:DUF4332 domain-containing protein [bacterium]